MIEATLWAALQRNDASDGTDHHPITDYVVVPVTTRARAVAPIIEVPAHVAAPVTGTIDDLETSLGAVCGEGRIAGLEWPSCCNALTVLHYVGGLGDTLAAAIDSGALDHCVLTDGDLPTPLDRSDWQSRMAAIRARRDSGGGMALVRCAVCLRVYGGWVIP